MKHLASYQIRVLIVDDEAEACHHLSSIIRAKEDPAIEIIGIAHDTLAAEKIIAEEKPNAVFMDIEMPGENAIQFLERIAPVPFQVIFVTAYDAYAIKAFRMNAVDYVLKPISRTEVTDAIEKLKSGRHWDKTPEDADLYRSVSQQLSQRGPLPKMRLRSGNQLDIVDISDLYYIEAQRAYSKICFRAGGRDKVIVMSRALTDYEEMLPADLFYRIHKSYLVNCAHIKGLVTTPVPAVVLQNEISLPVSRRRYASLLSFLSSNSFSSDHYK